MRYTYLHHLRKSKRSKSRSESERSRKKKKSGKSESESESEEESNVRNIHAVQGPKCLLVFARMATEKNR